MRLARSTFASVVALAIAGCLAACAPEPPAVVEAPELAERTGPTDWPAYLGGNDSAQYSALTQIDRSNVAGLEVAWVYNSGGADPEGRTNIQCNPIVRDGVLYGTNPMRKAFALDAATGAELWTFDPAQQDPELGTFGTARGLVYWQNDDASDRRILYVAGQRLYALDAGTGELVPGFGESGSVSLYIGFSEETHNLFMGSRTPGVVFENLLIFGSTTGETLPAPPGDVRAIDIRSGELVWRFHTIPHPGEPGYETWPEHVPGEFGSANNWAGMSLDVERELVYVPLGAAAYDFYGANRPGQNLYANSLVVLEARTGKLRWHYQTVHHDIWDRDLPMPPNLLTIVHEGRKRDVVAQLTKSAYIFVFDRETGEPIWPIEEVPVPTGSALPGEQPWPTQPIPTRPPQFSRGTLDPIADASNISPEYNELARERFARLRIGNYEPPSEQGTVVFPGFDGGGEWGGAAVDPESGIMYVNGSEVAWMLRMVEVDGADFETTADVGKMTYARNCLYCHGVDGQGDPLGDFPSLADLGSRLEEGEIRELVRTGKNRMPGAPHLGDDQVSNLLDYLLERGRPLSSDERAASRFRRDNLRYLSTGYIKILDPEGNPLIKPPWGRLHAIDLNRGEILWQVTLGELPELTARGIPPTGTENYGGPVVTKSGLIFIAATKDSQIRAFDTRDGSVLWQHELPASGYATPATYEVDGRQYVVVAAGGGRLGPPSSDAYVAFALPQ
jgi:quinoprotein glucose dehydrogenase